MRTPMMGTRNNAGVIGYYNAINRLLALSTRPSLLHVQANIPIVLDN
jgi:hypothetical protein